MIKTYGERNVAWVQGEDLASALAACDAGLADTLGFSTATGFSGKTLPPASMIGGSVKGVVAIYMAGVDVSAVADYGGLAYLSLHDFSGPFDFSRLTALEYLRADWSKQVVLPGPEVPLKRLYLCGYKPTSRALVELPPWPGLEELELVQGGLDALRGVSRYTGLKKITLAYLRRLSNIEEIQELSGLEEVEFDHCAHVEDFAVLGRLAELAVLHLSHCGTIPSVRFAARLEKLRHLSFVGTTVLDGDLEGLLGIAYVGFTDKAHYTRTFSDFKERRAEARDQDGEKWGQI